MILVSHILGAPTDPKPAVKSAVVFSRYFNYHQQI